MLPINFIAVLIASIVAFVLQFLISGPIFGRLRMKLDTDPSATNEKPANLGRKLLLNIVANMVTAYFIAAVYLFASTSRYAAAGMGQAVQCAFLLWLGFLVTATSIDVIWGKKPAKLWLFESAAALLVYVVMGAIIGLMQLA